MRIAIVTDAWVPQVNGVVRTLQATRAALEADGHQVTIVSPGEFGSVPCPTYPEIRLALARPRAVGMRVRDFAPDAIHLSTEGPLCLAARRWCLEQGLAFTTAYHTQFPDYLAARYGIGRDLAWRYLRWFHRPATAILVSTPRLADALRARGLPQARRWGRGVDLALFTPLGARDAAIAKLPRPIHLYVGRVAVEKNLTAFLAAERPGSMVVVGDGPARAALEQRFPRAHFLGPRSGDALAAAYRSADVLVFPSRTDTFGLVMIEALACGTPVAAYPVPGPLDVLAPGVAAMDDDLAAAMAAALTRPREDAARYARGFSWEAAARQFAAALVPADGTLRHAA